MSNLTALRGLCPPPFLQASNFPIEGGFTEGRLCQEFLTLECCLPCPMTDWVYPDNFNTLTKIADWVNVASTLACIFLLLSWAFLPVDKTNRHYLSISLACAVLLMSLGFTIPLAAQPQQCFNEITPHSMDSSPICAASGSFLIFGGFAGVMWVFMRSVSLHLQICWQVNVGKKFMWWAQGVGWGVPLVGLIVALVFSGVSFRFGSTCHINHDNSLADFWIPLLCFAGIALIVSLATFGYCIKVYLASLADDGPSTEGSGLPSYTSSIKTLSPRQAYRRVRRVIALQWRGITIVLIIIADVIFFSVVFVFQDTTTANVRSDPSVAVGWVQCLIANQGNRDPCLSQAGTLVIPQITVIVVLLLLALNGLWALFLMGRVSMVTGWIDLFQSFFGGGGSAKTEFVSVDARMDFKSNDTRSYEMLSRDTGKTPDALVTPDPGYTHSPYTPSALIKSPSPASPLAGSGRNSGDFFSQSPGPASPPPTSPLPASPVPPTTQYAVPPRSFSNPRPPPRGWTPSSPPRSWDAERTFARPNQPYPDGVDAMNPLGMNRI